MKWIRVKRLLFSHTDSLLWQELHVFFTGLERTEQNTMSRTKLFLSVNDSTWRSQSGFDLCNDAVNYLTFHSAECKLNCERINWKGQERRPSWPSLKYCSDTYLERLKNTTTIRIDYLWVPDLKMRHKRKKMRGVQNPMDMFVTWQLCPVYC